MKLIWNLHDLADFIFHLNWIKKEVFKAQIKGNDNCKVNCFVSFKKVKLRRWIMRRSMWRRTKEEEEEEEEDEQKEKSLIHKIKNYQRIKQTSSLKKIKPKWKLKITNLKFKIYNRRISLKKFEVLTLIC